jgi:hypothetical protein
MIFNFLMTGVDETLLWLGKKLRFLCMIRERASEQIERANEIFSAPLFDQVDPKFS